MTEKEYVEHVLQRAKAYIVEIEKDPGEMVEKPFEEWSGTKMALSAHTVAKLCETWLEAENGSGMNDI